MIVGAYLGAFSKFAARKDNNLNKISETIESSPGTISLFADVRGRLNKARKSASFCSN